MGRRNPQGPKQDNGKSLAKYITRIEALRMLQVKPATLYTYVSRGWIRRLATPGRKQSLYYREDVDRMRARSGARAADGVLAAGAIHYGEPIVPTSITELTPEGPKYRARAAVDLAQAGVGFEAVAELLWTGLMLEPQRWKLEPLPRKLLDVAGKLHEFDTDVSIHDAFSVLTLAAGMARGIPLTRVTESATPALAARQLILMLSGCFGFLAQRRCYRPPREGESVAQAIAKSLGVASSVAGLRALDAALILSADHELNPATFVARIAASSEGDLYSCIASAICTNSGARIARSCDRLEAFFRGPLTPKAFMQRVNEDPSQSDLASLAFNHPLYPDGDPRGRCLLRIVREIDAGSPEMRKTLRYLDTAKDRYGHHPRLEVALAVLAIALRLPAGTAAGIYTLGRVAGWVAHIAEQRLAGFLIRPRAKFAAPFAQ
jgi:citrate synthase